MKHIFHLVILLVASVESTTLGVVIWDAQPSNTWFYCAPSNGLSIGLKFYEIHFEIAAKAVDRKREGVTLVSLSRRQFGPMQLLDGQGRSVSVILTNYSDFANYPAVVGGEYTPADSWRPGQSWWPTVFPQRWNKHLFLQTNTNAQPHLAIPLTDYFDIQQEGNYIFKYRPVFYVQERPFKNTDLKPPKYRRLDFPPIIVNLRIQKLYEIPEPSR